MTRIPVPAQSFFILLVLSTLVVAQAISKKPLEHDDYDRWNTIGMQRLSNDGQWIMYSTQSGKVDGDTTLIIRKNGGVKEYAILRGRRAQFSDDGRYVAYQVAPDPKLVKKLKKEKAKPKDMPSSSMELLELENGKHITVERVKAFSFPKENSDWLAYLMESPVEKSTVKDQTSTVVESYEVTEEGLRRPVKPLKLKKRRGSAEEESKVEPTEESEATEQSPEPSEEKENAAEPKAKAKVSKGKPPKSGKDDDEAKTKDAGTELVIRNLLTGQERQFPNVSSCRFAKHGNVLAFATSVATEADQAKEEEADESEEPANEEPESEETKSEEEAELEAEKEAAENEAAENEEGESEEVESGEPATESDPEDADEATDDDPAAEPHGDGVHVLDLETQELTQVIDGLGNYEDLVFNEEGTSLTFTSDKDDYEAKTSSWSLYLWQSGSESAQLLAAEKGTGVPDGWWIASSASPYFTEDNRRLFFQTAPIPESVLKERAEAEQAKTDEKNGAQAKDDGKEDEEDKPKLDIWHWQDPQLQPQQLLQAEEERGRDYLAACDLETKEIIQLADEDFPSINIDPRATNDVAVGVTNLPYRKLMSWDIPGFRDSVLVNLETGERKVILEKKKSFARLSPEGKFVTWFDAETRQWFAASTEGDGSPVEISKGIEFALEDELHDTPSLPSPYGSAGWLTDDEAFLIYDRFDIWQLDPTGESEPVCLTEGFGRENSLRFRYVWLDDEARAIDLAEDLILSSFNDDTKADGFFVLKANSDDPPEGDEDADEKTTDDDEANDGSRLRSLIVLDENFGRLAKAKDSNDVVFTRSTFQRSPDLWGSTLEFKKIHRISDINPQQDEYLWGTVEQFCWKATDGQDLDGLLYKPEGFDPDKKYPLMVYFYERNSDNLHRYYAPAAGRSIINFSFYVSRGYVVFVPDIPYKTGEPGPSAANAVLPGTQAVIDLGFIDENRVGMQGHSWGGYQTAYLVTQTDMFACAESGAPVSNMTSAYGGIRWGSGMSRMFQYERTQSRIGDTLWSAREKYIANSPLFFVDKINTPLLILHNDEDGAVPWYQGIELFVAMRRLEKPAWLLNYNGNPHWVMGQTNRRDFATRMQQFFDHYLKDAPEPEWMAYGVPAVDKGEKLGLDLLEPKSLESGESSEASESNEEPSGTASENAEEEAVEEGVHN